MELRGIWGRRRCLKIQVSGKVEELEDCGKGETGNTEGNTGNECRRANKSPKFSRELNGKLFRR